MALSMAIVLSMTAISAYADFDDDVWGRVVKVGEPINFCEEIIPETQWYLIQSLYSGGDGGCFHIEDGCISMSFNGIDDVTDGMDPTTVEDLLIHFVPAYVSDAQYDTYYMQFANDAYARVYS